MPGYAGVAARVPTGTVAYRGLVSARDHGGSARRRLAVTATLTTVALLAGCSSADPARDDDAASRLLFSPDPATTAEPSPTPTATATPSLQPLQNDCQGVIGSADVVRIVGTALPGETTFVFADALPNIGRTGRVTCGYGDTGDGPKVTVTLNDYESVGAAAQRVDVTLQAASERGNVVRDQPVGPYDGHLLVDDDDVSLVVNVGPRTLVVTMQRGLVAKQAEVVVLERLAASVLGLPDESPEP